jgi:hypothetical protein
VFASINHLGNPISRLQDQAKCDRAPNPPREVQETLRTVERKRAQTIRLKIGLGIAWRWSLAYGEQRVEHGAAPEAMTINSPPP